MCYMKSVRWERQSLDDLRHVWESKQNKNRLTDTTVVVSSGEGLGDSEEGKESSRT